MYTEFKFSASNLIKHSSKQIVYLRKQKEKYQDFKVLFLKNK